jgi:hypothetical protein
MENQKKLFAFKLAEKQTNNGDRDNGKWKARDGVSAQSCTDIPGRTRSILTGGDLASGC